MEIAAGLSEDGIVVGNTYDKYGTKNPIARRLMAGFSGSLTSLVAKANPKAIHEVGCGEGYWIRKWRAQGMDARGSDFSEKVIALARENSRREAMPAERAGGDTESVFSVRSIYDLEAGKDSADLIVCCEVLEHLDKPLEGLKALQRVATNHVIVSVPREPIWRILNMARGKYWSDLGNTPGHLNHWSSLAFIRLIGQYFEIQEIRKPLPWTMLLCRVKG